MTSTVIGTVMLVGWIAIAASGIMLSTPDTIEQARQSVNVGVKDASVHETAEHRFTIWTYQQHPTNVTLVRDDIRLTVPVPANGDVRAYLPCIEDQRSVVNVVHNGHVKATLHGAACYDWSSNDADDSDDADEAAGSGDTSSGFGCDDPIFVYDEVYLC